ATLWSEYHAVWHLAPGLADSSGRHAAATDHGTTPIEAVMGEGRRLSAIAGQFIDTGCAHPLASFTAEAWARGTSDPVSAGSGGALMRENNYDLIWDQAVVSFRGAAAVRVGGTFFPASFGPLTGGRDEYLVATYDGQTLRSYVNGVLVTATVTGVGG